MQEFQYNKIIKILQLFNLPTLPQTEDFSLVNGMYKYKLIKEHRLHNIYIFKKDKIFYITKLELDECLRFYNIDSATIDLIKQEYEKTK